MATANVSEMFGVQQRRNEFPSCPEAALIIAGAFQRMGGWFSVCSNGKRGIGQPLYLEHCPQLADAKPHELMHSDDEMRGALKILLALFERFPKEDRDYVFAALAPIAVDERKLTPSIEEPRRAM
jgi:hypothetical protein